MKFLRHVLFPAILLFLCPLLVVAIHRAVNDQDGNPESLFLYLVSHPQTLVHVPRLAPSFRVIGYLMFHAVLLRILPCRQFTAPCGPSGYSQAYPSNGISAYITTWIVFGCLFLSGLWDPSSVVDDLPDMILTLNFLFLVASIALFVKGRLVPSTPEIVPGSHGLLFHMYFGVEVHPSIFGVHVKQLIISRFGMSAWILLAISCLRKEFVTFSQNSPAMLASVVVQLFYVSKFYVWEEGYMSSVDMQKDGCGFMLAWGPAVWMPVIHTLQNLFILRHPNDITMSTGSALIISTTGILAAYLNYAADAQRLYVRSDPLKARVWGKAPLLIPAQYTTRDGVLHHTFLLANGFHGITRHFHYAADLLVTFCVCIPAGISSILAHVHFLYLFGLLIDRAKRVDAMCLEKYGKAWKAYCDRVPYRIIPWVY